jgi:hypothetical protein
MGTVLNPSGAQLAALSTTTKVIEIAIVAVVVVLLLVTLVLYRRKSAPPKTAGGPQAPAVTQNYYGDVTSLPNGQGALAGAQGPGGSSAPIDSFGGFAPAPGAVPSPAVAAPAAASFGSSPAPAPFGSAPAAAPAPPPAPTSAPTIPPPGTPAGWLPEPSGVPNTLRYWDGSAWTQHVAQRS